MWSVSLFKTIGHCRNVEVVVGTMIISNMDISVKQKNLRLLTNGIYVLTSRDGDRYGAATVTWVSQVSFKPPLIMAALRKGRSVFNCLAANGILCTTQMVQL